MRLTRRDFAAGIVAGIAAPHIITSAQAQGSTIKIGMCVPVTGPAAEQGLWAQNGAKLALAAVNKAGGVLGKQVELVIEDDQTTNPGIVLAFSKLAGQSDIVAFLGPIRCTQVQAMAPDVLKLGKPVMIGGTNPGLTHSGNPWLFRVRPNDSYSARVIADFGVNSLQEEVGDRAFHRRLRHRRRQGADRRAARLGAPPVLDQGYTNNSQDFTPVVLAIKKSGADMLGTYMTIRGRLGIFAKQLAPARRQHPLGRFALDGDGHGDEAGGSRTARHLCCGRLRRGSSEAPRRSARYTATSTSSRPTTRAAWPTTPSRARRRRSTRPARPSPARSATRSWPSRKYAGVEGDYYFDKNGDGLHGYNVVRNENGKIIYVKHIDFND